MVVGEEVAEVMEGSGGQPPPVPTNVIGASGGTYSAQGYKVVIPAGALSTDVAFTIIPVTENNLPSVCPSNTSLLSCAEFGPDNIQFNSAIDITCPLSYTLIPGDTYDLYVYNSTQDNWEDTGIDGIVYANGMAVTATVTHFSAYAFFNNIPNTISANRGGWFAAGSLSESLRGHKATLLADGRVLVTGGYTTYYNLYYSFIYNPTTNVWIDTDFMNYPRSDHTSTLLVSCPV